MGNFYLFVIDNGKGRIQTALMGKDCGYPDVFVRTWVCSRSLLFCIAAFLWSRVSLWYTNSVFDCSYWGDCFPSHGKICNLRC